MEPIAEFYSQRVPCSYRPVRYYHTGNDLPADLCLEERHSWVGRRWRDVRVVSLVDEICAGQPPFKPWSDHVHLLPQYSESAV